MTASKPTTSAQRQAALRQRAREIAFGIDDDAVRAAPDSVLVEGLAMAYRAKQVAPVEAIAAELLLRLGKVEPRSVTVTAPDPVTVTQPPATEQPRIVTVTPPETPPGPVTVTPPETVTATKPPRHFSREARLLGIRLADAGKPSGEICAAIEAAHGKAPDPTNLAKLLRGWRKAVALTDPRDP